MKSILFFLITITGIASCSSNPQASSETQAVQHDTIKANSKITITTSDSVIKTGEYIKHYKNGVIEMRGLMKDGKREGLWKSWYDNGSPWSETTFSNGIKDGKTTTWYENEQKRYAGFYKDDKESGKWTYWDEKGKVVTIKDYDEN